jgi:hypothetical protein
VTWSCDGAGAASPEDDRQHPPYHSRQSEVVEARGFRIPKLGGFTMNTPSTIDVICPCCQTHLTIDPSQQTVLHHEAPAKATPSVDLQQALGALKSEANRREAQFQQALTAEREKGKVLEKKFEEFLKKAKEDRSPPPPRPIDLD